MGFFSSRKAEDNENYVIAASGGTGGGSVVHVIRSRFYGRKGKEREEEPPTYLSPPNASVAQTPATSASPFAPRSSTSNRTPGPSILRNQHNHSLPSPLSSPITATRVRDDAHFKAASAALRKTTDTVTYVLQQCFSISLVLSTPPIMQDYVGRATQRAGRCEFRGSVEVRGYGFFGVRGMNFCSSDDEYRLLRQNLFERFATSTAVPTENPVVPAARPRPNKTSPDGQVPSRPLSNFSIDVPRPTSIHSRNSMASGVADLFRRATGRTASKDVSDTSSVWSATSTASNIFKLPRVLSRKGSVSSVRTDISRAQVDTISISSRRGGHASSSQGHSDTSHFSPTSRSTAASIRRMATPPSSFPARIIGQEPKISSNIYSMFDEDNLKTSQEIKDEIMAVEAEAKRLMDAFNGLELTTLTKNQRHHIRPTIRSTDWGKGSNGESTWTGSNGRSRVDLTDNDGLSVQSRTSGGTSPSFDPSSMSRSAHSIRKAGRPKATSNQLLSMGSISRPSSLHRKNSSSSVLSIERRGGRVLKPPPVPVLPTMYLHSASRSNVSLTRSAGHLPMMPEEDKSMSGTTDTLRVEQDEEDEMEDIRRRREEVSVRYEARLEYLRAKLKGAQLHEKLLRK
ncbi:hypothetical protein K443DRAFT_479296 [Laccaria amethystina LaAM-08-1]|uniref:Unplaced genomic scaffold K443scaffold_46, whole genome shotgun sequence n=1 Tax=Laccaria amethystina LaAM-08-1 TaxID=1095629 RepID=A0A0C9XEJ2_9AGAR|nr:hypothetical protein K443DRAFT_479296 [Laccaria amethystina LaAM-08-1]